MPHLKLQFAHFANLTIAPIMINRRWWFKREAQRRPLRARNADPRGLFRQRAIHELVALVQTDLRVWFQFLERGNAADVIEMRVGQRDRLQVKTEPFESLDDAFSFVAGVDADRLPC